MSMELVLAVRSDLPLLAILRNDPDSARYSKRGVLSLEQIEADYFDNPHKTAFVVQDVGRPIGYAIFATLGGDAYEISVALVPELRGTGRGVALIRAASTHGFASLSAIRILALIFADNVGSTRAFERAGYVYESRQDGLCTYVFTGNTFGGRPPVGSGS